MRKRAQSLARLLAAKAFFQQLNWHLPGGTLLDQINSSVAGRRAVVTALRELRKAGLSSQIADLSVCGAVAPYNELLGGKLVALLMASAEVRSAYASRYGDQISVISSQMAGRPISRSADLKVLTTTSLYGNGSSQYNRLWLRHKNWPRLRQDIVWEELTQTAGYGTVHLSTLTVNALRQISEREYGARRVNHRFGEGASPRMRQVREGVEALGVDSDAILNHATPRLMYACALVPDAWDMLIDLKRNTNHKAAAVANIAEAWRCRWLARRLLRTETLDRLEHLGPSTIYKDLVRFDREGQLSLAFEA